MRALGLTPQLETKARQLCLGLEKFQNEFDPSETIDEEADDELGVVSCSPVKLFDVQKRDEQFDVAKKLERYLFNSLILFVFL
jgi:hypothetical protein